MKKGEKTTKLFKKIILKGGKILIGHEGFVEGDVYIEGGTITKIVTSHPQGDSSPLKKE